ncbi:hypothetical protein DI09_29p240 [Mitosporidium daphniae]|uniref:Uncharacterized protein n=1 Tax=Mitosporidium daphniae TaxID=1485682 RepID=A0A098VRM0_9MICR|nr:uncharacterized protein DI09_29p240 [Mitosporidium daphniae]KGG51703.1 hypothetical protein DI09_29p240 [Mitosporidium daphniae]|eukprot:XP_013238130.1 uncharacterized protein DI09_29p240 [Mitosporidium daphniae]
MKKPPKSIKPESLSDEQWLDQLMKSRKPKTPPTVKEPAQKEHKRSKVKSQASESWLDISTNPESSSKERRLTEDGYPIYQLSELISTAGGGIFDV